MSAVFKTRLHAANDGPPLAPATRMPKAGPRVVPLITLRQPKKKSIHWAIPCVSMLLFAGAAAAFWYLDNVTDVLKLPSLEQVAVVLPDPEDAPAYAETITPPLADVIAPLPVLPDTLATIATAANDGAVSIVLPASSLQAPYPATSEVTKPNPAVAEIESKIKDIPLSQTASAHDDSQIEVGNVQTSAINTLLDKAQAKLDAYDEKGALAIYDRILARDPANRAALTGKASVLGNAGQYEAAAGAYHRLLALNPKDETARVNLVSSLGSWGTPVASNELQRMVKARPGFALAQAALAQALVNQDKALAALPHAWRAMQIEPDNILYRLNLAIAYDRLGHSGEAIGFYRDVLKAYGAADTRAPALPVSPPEIRQRVDYLDALMESAGKQALSP